MGLRPFALAVVLAPAPSKLSMITLAPLSDRSVELPDSFRLFILFSCLNRFHVFSRSGALRPSSRFRFFARLTFLSRIRRFSRFCVLMCLVGLNGCAHKSVLSVKLP